MFSQAQLFSINALCPLDGRYANSIIELRNILSEKGLLKYRVKVEITWLIALSKSGLEKISYLDSQEIEYLHSLYNLFDEQDAIRIKEIEQITNHDVKAVEYWIKESIGLKLQEHIANKLAPKEFKNQLINTNNLKNSAEFIHFACTSEDINNIAYALMLQDARAVLAQKITYIIDNLSQLAKQYADIPMLSRTHGQAASPTTVGKELANIVYRLHYALDNISKVKLKGKLNGAVGNYNAHIIAYPQFDWVNFSKNLIENTFNLSHNSHTTQIEPHDYMAELFDAVVRFNTILIDFNRDIWGYISLGYFRQKLKHGEIGSSTMPHKVNPIDFENSEGNLGVANALLSHLAQKLPISRWQRDLTDSTVLRNIGIAFGYSLLAYNSCLKGIDKLEINNIAIEQDLDNCWEILAEPIQTIMRKYNIDNPYEKLKQLTRGKQIDNISIKNFINQLDIPQYEKEQLLALTPRSYIGIAKELARTL